MFHERPVSFINKKSMISDAMIFLFDFETDISRLVKKERECFYYWLCNPIELYSLLVLWVFSYSQMFIRLENGQTRKGGYRVHCTPKVESF
jgi:hypothetical protein